MVEAFDRSKHLPSSSPSSIHELFLTVKLRKPTHQLWWFCQALCRKRFYMWAQISVLFWRHRIDESKADLNVFPNPKQIRAKYNIPLWLYNPFCVILILLIRTQLTPRYWLYIVYNVELCFTNTWIVTVAFLTKNMMTGEMTRTNKRTAIPNACCWLAAYNSFLTISLKTTPLETFTFKQLVANNNLLLLQENSWSFVAFTHTILSLKFSKTSLRFSV